MQNRSYLDRLDRHVAGGLRGLPESFRARHAEFARGLQQDDGGFPGRAGPSDLYYTGFALRTLAMLGDHDPQVWGRAAAFVQGEPERASDVVGCFSMLHARRLVASQGHRCWDDLDEHRCAAHCRAVLERHRCDGGYARRSGGAASLYHTFLAALCLELLDGCRPDPAAVVRLVQQRSRPDGGLCDLGEAERGETNPTAAGVALLAMAKALDRPRAQAIARFLALMQRPDGGFAAHGDAPVSDLLSTFTAVVSLAALRSLAAVRRADVARSVRRLEALPGGFCGAAVGDDPDAEYTYYGLGVVGILHGHATSWPARLARWASRPVPWLGRRS